MRQEADSSSVAGSGKSDETLRRERRRADEVVLAERVRADVAITQERDEKRVAERILLTQERGQTDRDLADERKRTDDDLGASDGRLTAEQSAHHETKFVLATREELMAIVSHDLRNPIGAVRSCASMLLDCSFDEKLDDETRTWVAFMERNAEAALRLVEDLLDMERMSHGKLELQPNRCDISKLVAESLQMFASLAAAKSILLRATPPRVPVLATIDRDRIMQVLSNLIGNAVKFTPEGGLIDLQVKPDDASNTVQVSVKDNGPGIPPDKIGRIFERFSQIGSKDRHGLGLGLYISKKIVEAHGGTILVDSTLGKGSRFSLHLPRSTQG
jgi:signal transduction histidine kinase